jgi:hypothetical protein
LQNASAGKPIGPSAGWLGETTFNCVYQVVSKVMEVGGIRVIRVKIVAAH